MTILWCGGEDIDFQLGAGVVTDSINSNYYIPYYARCGLYSSSFMRSIPFVVGSVTSAWLSAHLVIPSGFTAIMFFGVTDSNGNYLFIGSSNSNKNKTALWTASGTTKIEIASEAGTNLNTSGEFQIINVCITNYGSAANVLVYVNNFLAIDYTGNVTINDSSFFNSVAVHGYDINYGGLVSEIIVADEDTRLMRLKTLAPSAAGDSSTNWVGAYTDIDEVTISDADKIYSSTADADFQCNLTGMPTGTFSVKAVKVAARCVDGSGSKGVALGVKSGGTINVGDTETCAGYWQTKERLMTVNPVTGVAFTPADIEALQINLRAKAL